MRMSWTIPYGYNLKSIKTPQMHFLNVHTNQGFQRRDRSIFMFVQLSSQLRLPHPPFYNSLLVLFAYDVLAGTLQHEIVRPLSIADSPVYVAYEAHMASIIFNKQKGSPQLL